jgi:hypothetical protein
MDANKIIEVLLEKIKGLTKENAFLVAQLQSIEEERQAELNKESEENA